MTNVFSVIITIYCISKIIMSDDENITFMTGSIVKIETELILK